MLKEGDSFEMKMENLTSILNKLKDENLNLNDSVELYKNGINAIKDAREILDNAKLVVAEIQGKSNG